ncbi:MAG TPA: lipopolysaccharide biosynthesis protein [Trebonia sp.]|jgi:O-antigen/teichoic acid export membrane protein
MNAQQSSGLSSKVRDMWEKNQDLLRNAGSLAATTGMTSIFGFVFTIVAARMFLPNAVGWGNAAINAMQLFGTIGMFGLGTMLIGELPKRKGDRGGLFAASVSTSFIGSVILGLIFAIVVGMYFTNSLPGVGANLGEVLLFVLGTALTGATMVFDEGTIGMLRGGVQLWRNMSLSAIKLVALPVTAVLLHDKFGVGLSLSYVIGIVGSLIPASIMLVRGGTRLYHRPDWQALRRLLPVAINHNWLNLAMATPSRIIPIVVVVSVGSSKGAVFYVAWMITALLFMVPVHLGTVLFALASASPQVVAEKLRFVLRVSLLIGLPVMAVLAIGAHFMLGLYDSPKNHFIYSHLGTVPLWLLVIGYIPQMPRAQFIAVSRATNRVGQAAGLICFFACCEIGSIYVGGRLGGLDGLSFAYLGVLCMEGLITAPTVLRAAYAVTATAAATGAFPAVPAGAATGSFARSGPLARVTGELAKLTGSFAALPGVPDRQEGGLAALFAIASAAAASEGHTLDVATEVWRTGAFPAIPADATGPRKVQRPAAPTSYDMLRGRAAPTVKTPQQQANYRRRQQAGIDALLAIATPVTQQDDPQQESRSDSGEPLITNRNGKRS